MSQGNKNDIEKPPMDLLSGAALKAISEVLAFGAKKYARHNWRKGISWSRILAATMRHVTAFMDGEDLDSETGLPHIDHAMCELMFLVEFYRTRKDLDDRWKPTVPVKIERMISRVVDPFGPVIDGDF